MDLDDQADLLLLHLQKITKVIFMTGKIFVVTHVKPKNKLSKGYDYIGVGNTNLDLSYHDNTGESISHLNPFFSELTAIYWIWKNYDCSPDDFVGIMHYRRLLVDGWIPSLTKTPARIESIEEILEVKDLIVPEKIYLPPNIYQNYLEEHNEDDLKLVLSVAEKIDGAQKEKYIDFLKTQNMAHVCNMLICKKTIFDNYCSWLFPILFESLDQIDFKDRNAYQKRVFGFLSERLFNVWLNSKNYSVEALPIIRTDFSFFKNFNRRRLNNRRINE